jgi:hypothetical protein
MMTVHLQSTGHQICAGRARQALDLTSEPITAIETALVYRWITTPIDAAAHREKLYHTAAALRAVRKALTDAVQAGEVVRHAAAMAELMGPNAEKRL